MVLPLLIAAAGLGAAGKIFQGIAGNTAARARARALRMGAQQSLNEAGIAASMGLEDDARMQGHAATVAAANGGGFTGSAMDVLADLQRQSLFKARTAVYRGLGEASAKISGAQVARREGTDGLISAGFGATSSILSGFAKASSAKAGGGG